MLPGRSLWKFLALFLPLALFLLLLNVEISNPRTTSTTPARQFLLTTPDASTPESYIVFPLLEVSDRWSKTSSIRLPLATKVPSWRSSTILGLNCKWIKWHTVWPQPKLQCFVRLRIAKLVESWIIGVIIGYLEENVEIFPRAHVDIVI